MGVKECGSNSRNEAAYCVPLTRLPALGGADTVAPGNYGGSGC